MLFNSLQFSLFFLVVVTAYFLLPHRYRWGLLLVSSYYFYMCWKAEYVLLIMFSTVVDYFAALRMSALTDQKRRKKYLALSLTCNLSILFFFKYFNFLSQSVHQTLQSINIFYDTPLFKVLLPVGISFYTFQTLSYTIDVYKGRVSAERHLGIYALYVSFWPQLVAGPIERTKHLLPQLRQRYEFDYPRVVGGLRLMLWGLFKKVVIADQLAVYVNRVYNHVDDYQGLPLVVATFFFAIQIYCDFSGYTDMARGAARVMGFDLMENFRRPYFAKSIREFWQRWHISLSTWFRDYVYIPLGGNRGVKWRWYYNLMITFLLSGLWHGANWTFVVWGGLHGFYLVIENMSGSFQARIARCISAGEQTFMNRLTRLAMTMTMICFAWIFFRANSLGDAFSVLGNMFVMHSSTTAISVVGLPLLLCDLCLVLFLFTVDMLERKHSIQDVIADLPLTLRWLFYTILLWIIAVAGVFGTRQEFIYFQF
ncbi:MBOAT family protein [Desulforhopalus sp. IMCC35007]|uniref:MBOAT family O-acyltransferase n=1 Tax=Desulforhopalus sp. IMCC35007 TaxID=2569543 RepID=UPI0010AE4E2B|nr:MBOAT family O-acyltransferase [Desulforhopalus sp. IMCC35007]TKB08563.1 MBOAT family protein [Desulforhopalus sp. IMCC35007]